MPRKIRELKADLRRAHFVWRPGTGSHGGWVHERFAEIRVVLSGNDGRDAQAYEERNLVVALEKLRIAEERLP